MNLFQYRHLQTRISLSDNSILFSMHDCNLYLNVMGKCIVVHVRRSNCVIAQRS